MARRAKAKPTPITPHMAEGAVGWLVNRMHVSTPDARVVRDLYARMRGKSQWPKAVRKHAYRYALECHHSNQETFVFVQRGR